MSDNHAQILLIDDDEDIHLAVGLMLASEGYALACCRTSEEGRARMRQRRPDLLLLDIMLADPYEGLEVACEMRQDDRYRTVPIVFISAVAESVSADYAKANCPVELSAAMFLEKPLEAATLRAAVRRVLDGRRV
jgi:DNA-binding response OmpR family regulator